MLNAVRTDIPRQVRERDLRLIRFLYCDYSSIIRAKAIHARSLEDRMRSGIGLGKAALARTVLDQLAAVEGLGQIGEVRLLPDPDTFMVLPYTARTASMCADLVSSEDEPWPFCPRSFLKRMLARLNARGLHLQASFEGSFTLTTESGAFQLPDARGGYLSTSAMNAAAPAINAMLDALEAQHLSVEQYSAEAGRGQHQIAIRHAEGLAAADGQIAFRETVRGTAQDHGLRVSFAPKTRVDQPGNPCHVHFSLTGNDNRASRFYEADEPYQLSVTARQFIAGVVEHLPGLTALGAASVNSYRRLQTDLADAAYASWGPDSRLSAVRVASPLAGNESATLHAELRISDYSANPYLLLGGLIAAGLDGITHEQSLPHPLLEDPKTLGDQDRLGYGMTPLPHSLAEALDALAADEVLGSAFGRELLAAVDGVKRLEVQAFAEKDIACEADVFAAAL